MIVIQRIQLILLGLALATAGLALAAARDWTTAAVFLLPAALWLSQRRLPASWPLSSAALVAFAILCGWAVWRGAATFPVLAGLVSFLAVWDLDHFNQQLASAGRIEEEKRVVRARLLWLAAAGGLGLLLAGLTLNIEFDLPFFWIFFLGLSLILGLGALARWLDGMIESG